MPSALPYGNRHMHQCPRCTSDRIHFSRTKSTWEAWRRKITGKRPYRCPGCAWRGWAPDSGPRFSPDEVDAASRAIAPDPPNLEDTVFARAERRPQDIDLGHLDAAMPGRQDPAPQD